LRLLASTQADAALAVAGTAAMAGMASAVASAATSTVLHNCGVTDIGGFLPEVSDERSGEYRPAMGACQSRGNMRTAPTAQIG
jgi:hypothetical protein